jgi:hypothetical protein
MWNATVEIDSNSYVQLHVVDEGFRPEAMLHGRMGLKVRSSGSSRPLAEFDRLEFKCLHITTAFPYLEVGYFGYTGEVTFSNFPVSIEAISVTAYEGRAKLGFTVKINLMEGNFAARTRLEVKSELRQDANGDHSWKYDGIAITAIAINATISGSLKIEGGLVILEDDPVYGDGIAGQLQATFIPVKVEVTARAMFGAKNFRY